MPSPARDFNLQAVHYIRKQFDFTSVIGGTYEIGTIPAGARLLPQHCKYYHDVALSGTTNTMSVGFAADGVSSANSTAYLAATALLTTTEGYELAMAALSTATLAKPVTVDRTVTMTFAGTATTGIVDVVIGYVPKR